MSDAYNGFTPAFGNEQEPAWVHTLKADIRLIIRSELAEGFSLNQSLVGARTQDQLAQKPPNDVQLLSNFSDGTVLERLPSNISINGERWKNEWRHKQSERMTEKLSRDKQKLDKSLPFVVQQAFHIRKWWLDFLASRPVPDTAFVHLVKSVQFISFFLFLIVLNACWMGYEAQASMRHGDKRAIPLHVFMKWFFSIGFSIEIGLKVLALKWHFIGGEDWRWNIFDCLMVLLSVPSLFGISVNVTFARVLKLVRMVRVLRVFRVVRAFKELRHMIVAVHGSIVTLFWCGILFLFGMFCFAVMIMQTASTYISEATTPHELQVVMRLQNKYGSLQQSLLTLFHTVSGGDWLVASTPLEEVFEGYNYIFALYIFFMFVGFLNVVIGLFCDRAAGAVESDRDLRTLRELEETENFILEMREIFEEMDTDNTGEITWPQFEHYITSEGTGHFLRSHGIATHDAWELFELLDEIDDAPSGSMNVVSFVMGMQRLAGGGTDVVLSLVEGRKRARALEKLIKSVKDQVAEEFQQLRFLLQPTRMSPRISPRISHSGRSASYWDI